MATVTKNREYTILDFTKVLASILKSTNAKISLIEELPGNVNKVFITRQDSESSPEKDITGGYFSLFYVSGCETFYMGYCCQRSVEKMERVSFSFLKKNGIKFIKKDINDWLFDEE